MLKGLERFKRHFDVFSGSYLLIGGTACTLAMKEVGLDFRATKDLDIVLCLESLHPKFGQAVWEFVKQGQYENLQRSSGKRLFYRFHSPRDSTYPDMLELFSRKPDTIMVPKGCHLTPLPQEEEISSLSAILLDPEYYSFIQAGKRIIDGLPTLCPEYLILMKVKAWLNHCSTSKNGAHNAKKHKNDILRLSQLLSFNTQIFVPRAISQDLHYFLLELKQNPPDLRSLGLKNQTLETTQRLLETVYVISA